MDTPTRRKIAADTSITATQSMSFDDMPDARAAISPTRYKYADALARYSSRRFSPLDFLPIRRAIFACCIGFDKIN
jgi:hypothetical protein